MFYFIFAIEYLLYSNCHFFCKLAWCCHPYGAFIKVKKRGNSYKYISIIYCYIFSPIFVTAHTFTEFGCCLATVYGKLTQFTLRTDDSTLAFPATSVVLHSSCLSSCYRKWSSLFHALGNHHHSFFFLSKLQKTSKMTWMIYRDWLKKSSICKKKTKKKTSTYLKATSLCILHSFIQNPCLSH